MKQTELFAEGVETEEQREFLSDLGCNAFQGFLCGHPMPLVEFETCLAPPEPVSSTSVK